MALNAHFEGEFIARSVTEQDVRAKLRPYHDCGCSIAERTAAHISASHSEMIPLYELEKRNAFDGTHEREQNFAAARLAAAVSELRDMVVDAWRSSADAAVGYPPVKVRDVETGDRVPIDELKDLD